MKDSIDPDKIAAATEALKAIANDRRLFILCLLLDGPCNVTELQTATGFSQSNLSQHLAKMRTMGVLTCKRNGKQVYYALAHPAFKKIIEALKEIFCP
ncbi:MAG: winged helix-turn-helix transcriptional regulator [Gammaproteobacteria bacterium]|nr:winged helix-turn-helix transcriptional regulator [Gammaproteobacteria bacterium]